MKVSEYYGLDMYSDRGNYIGEVQEVMLDLAEGEVVGLVFERDEERNKMVPYRNVMAVGDLILVSTKKESETEEEKEVPSEGE